MICNLPYWWAFLSYDGFKSHMCVTEGIKDFADNWIKVGKEESGTSYFNQAFDNFQ